jgi:hypothetical protein
LKHVKRSWLTFQLRVLQRWSYAEEGSLKSALIPAKNTLRREPAVLRNGSKEMTEGSNKLGHIDFDQEIESTAVAGAVAVQKLIADRNRLREELTASLAAQFELKRRLGVLHKQYVEVATKVVAGMQHFDGAMRAAIACGTPVTDGTELKPQFDNNGVPLNSHPNGNGVPTNGTARLQP